MINDEPDARDLVAIALTSFRDTILPLVPAEQRFTALMIANALATAERELAAGDKAEPDLAAAIGGLIGEEGALSVPLAVLVPRLCAAIADGRFDAAEPQAALRRVLFDLTRARLAVSNPKLLAAGR